MMQRTKNVSVGDSACHQFIMHGSRSRALPSVESFNSHAKLATSEQNKSSKDKLKSVCYNSIIYDLRFLSSFSNIFLLHKRSWY